jgi:Tol biopolymer transport system component
MRGQKSWFWTIATLSIGAVAWCATIALAASGSSASVAVNGQIAWKSFPRVAHNTWSIYAANPNGSNPRRLTNPGAGVEDDLPDWSPDGTNIVFERIFQSGTNAPPTVADEIMRVNTDGSGLRQIGTCRGRCLVNDDPQYSPDGRQIVYTRLMHVRSGALVLGVWVMNADGSNPHQITQLSASARSEDHEPAWSPNGKNVVFMRLNDTAAPANHQALFVVASNGGTPRRITSWRLNAGGPNWSPNGSKILFQSYRDCSCSQTSQVYTIAPGGSGVKRLTSAGRNIEPNWSPDGKKIVYAHQLGGIGANQLPALWSMSANGKNKRPLIQSNRWDSEPDWGTAPPTS